MAAICALISVEGTRIEPGLVEAMLRRMTWRADGPSAAAQGAATAVGICSRRVVSGDPSEREGVASAHGASIVGDLRLDNRSSLLERLPPEAEALKSDAEIVLASYIAHGTSVFDLLRGDFAAVIVDHVARSAIAIRDCFGTRPLYYTVRSGLVAFASDPDAFLELPPHRLRPNPQAVARFFLESALDVTDLESTPFDDVFRVPPSHVLFVGPAGIRKRRYFSFRETPPSEPASTAEVLRSFRQHFDTAVSRRLHHGRRVGAMLSGGLDSSAIVAVAKGMLEKRGERLKTFSILLDDPLVCGESPWVLPRIAIGDLAAAVLRPGETEAIDPAFDRLLLSFRQPNDFFSCDIVFAATEMARLAGCDVLLDGIDGDDVVSHGLRHARYALLNHEFPELWRAARHWENYYPGQSAPGYLLSEALLPLIRQWAVGWARRGHTIRSLLRERGRRRLEGQVLQSPIALSAFVESGLAAKIAEAEDSVRAESVPPDRSGHSDHGRILEAGWLVEAVERYDRIAAYAGVESRHPFMDRDLASFCVGLPWREKRLGGWSKSLVRRGFRGVLPEAQLWRGLGPTAFVALRQSFFSRRHEWMADELSSAARLLAGTFRKEALEEAAMDLWRARQESRSPGDRTVRLAWSASWFRRLTEG